MLWKPSWWGCRLTALTLGIAAFASGSLVGSPAVSDLCQSETGTLAEERFYACARLVSVKILNGKSWGSGTIVWRRGDRHGVLTNAHVLRAAVARSHYCVQTADGRVHVAFVSKAVRFPNADLALLEFFSADAYRSVRFADDPSVLLHQPVAIVGFPYPSEASPRQIAVDGFAFERGTVRRQLERPLQDGYQIGYDGWVGKGMSGGAVLDASGKAIAIAGWHARPLWMQSFVFQDGREPSPQIQRELARLNWGIPVQRFQESLTALSASDPPISTATCGDRHGR